MTTLPWVVLALRDMGKWFSSSYHASEDDARAHARLFVLDYPDALTEVTTEDRRRTVLDALNADLLDSRPGRWPRHANPRVEELIRVAAEFDVAADTLGQYVTRSGPYSVPRKPRSDARLPVWGSDDGVSLVERVNEICRPYSPRYVGILSRSYSASGSDSVGRGLDVSPSGVEG